MSCLSFIIPTRDRIDELDKTLHAINSYPTEQLGNLRPEVFVIDNASRDRVSQLLHVHNYRNINLNIITLEENIGTAARNIGAQQATGDWIVMLDDDSAPTGGDFAGTLNDVPGDVGAVGGEIFLTDGNHESGGLPEVVVGCGCAIRREVFIEVGGYDPSFDYYAEEYDLCAKLIQTGYRILHTDSVRFEHRKVIQGRDFAAILFRLVRNNAWVIARHCPVHLREGVLEAMMSRYREIAKKEDVEDAYQQAVVEVQAGIRDQQSIPLSTEQWRRFSGVDAASRLVNRLVSQCVTDVSLVAVGKGEDVIRDQLGDARIQINPDACTQVIGTLSPGPMLDAQKRFPHALASWSLSTDLLYL
tara:strand:- start:15661 stop:16737 length:1077 start_codon:yes stop_codon:yes gene_type:complete